MLDWHNLLEVNLSLGKLLRVPNLQTGKFEPLVTAFTEDEEEQMKSFLKRIDTVARVGGGHQCLQAFDNHSICNI